MYKMLLLTAALTSSTAALAAAPDLSIETVLAFDAGLVEVTVHVMNIGDAASPAVWVDLYGSKGNQWSHESQNTHHDFFLHALNPGQDEKVIFVLTHDEWMDNGVVFATVDVDRTAAEQDESNNMAKLIIMDWSPTEPLLACGTTSVVPAVLQLAPFMSINFLQSNLPALSCKSRAL